MGLLYVSWLCLGAFVGKKGMIVNNQSFLHLGFFDYLFDISVVELAFHLRSGDRTFPLR